MTRDELKRAIVRARSLRAFSPAVDEVLALARTPGTSSEQIAAAIKRDHAVALKILKLANSSAYTCGKRIESVDAGEAS